MKLGLFGLLLTSLPLSSTRFWVFGLQLSSTQSLPSWPWLAGSAGMALFAIDGPAGAGKTTFAQKLEDEYSISSTVQTIHLDDLYNGWETALDQELTQRLAYITSSHAAGREFSLKIFNWKIMRFDHTQFYEPTEFLILEGVGAAQEVVRTAGATTYWCEIDDEIGLKRVLDRDGAHLELQMRNWQKQQRLHFISDQTRENCQIKLTS